VACKYICTITFVINQYGTGIPVAFFFHKYGDAPIIRGFFDNLAVLATNSPRAASWPAPPPPKTGDWAPAELARCVAARAAAKPGAPSIAEGPVVACCPAYMIIDCDKAETRAAEDCMWAGGYQGYGLPLAEFRMFVVWCSWHLLMAWHRKVDKYVAQNASVAKSLRAALSMLLHDSVEVSPSAIAIVL
jgi:hypothetical protein